MRAFPLQKNYATRIVELEAYEAKTTILKAFIAVLIVLKVINLF